MDRSSSHGRPLRVCYPFIGNNVGGSHISTAMLVSQLDRRRVEPVVVLHEDGALGRYLRDRGLTFRSIDVSDYFAPPYWSFQNITKLLAQTAPIAAFLRRAQIDIVHANDVRIHFGWTLATRLAGAKLIWHQRTGSFGNSRVKLAFAKLSRQVVCISRYTASTLPQSLAPLTTVVANPFDVGFAAIDRAGARARLNAELSLAPDTRVIGFFGNLVPQKRPEVFLRAAAEIDRRAAGRFAFLLFGAERNDAEARLTQLANELRIENRVRFMGFRAPIEPWMAACELIIAPGIGEGLGRSLVEAMIVGTPVIAADSGGHRDVVRHGENGFLAAPDDAEGFAAAACALLKDRRLAAKIGSLAQAEAVRLYSIESHVEAMTNIYLACLGLGPSGEETAPRLDASNLGFDKLTRQ